MKETEKRLGLQSQNVAALKKKVDDVYTLSRVVRRSLLIKTGKDFVADPKTLVDIKIKLIEDESLFSVKHGVWHADTTRQEYETRFERSDLASLLASLRILTYDKFILLSTRRSIWETDGFIVTLDEYTNAGGKALFEVETTRDLKDEADIDKLFASLGVLPMDSAATIAFISEVNQSDGVQIDLRKKSPEDVASLMLRSHK